MAASTAAAGKLVLRNKCILLGNAGVGKSAITQMFHSDGTQYPKTYAMTIHSEVCVKVVNIPDTSVTVEMFLYDLAGHEVFQEHLPRYCEGAASFMLVYDVTNMDSFKNLTKWLQIARRGKAGKASQGVLLANKIDQTSRRVVPSAMGEDFAKAQGLAYFECSAANNVDVDAPFYFLSNALHESFEETLRMFVKGGEAAS
ncbi:P-loop containing nucleoside triphosphate hydrolase protein [Blyttiomyces helicus]|uniref:P-loop containing nucleoside triphosphate hydrolase protein n=1 Tax=Blyttiomyces helicus TaxID=388810 RepID=A0A4V1ISM8_9FUNG|nr:P-loop containing nucleoside triphosphate hydrolase protein [Blyttiomyces helicus]|eukprot:RKO94107.1 P-loop containing nucleoside triphosphate hydrolase protein [Blyttiomyces helicus]